MKVLARIAGLLVFIVALMIPALQAQDKKDPKKADAKEVKKAPPKDAKKDAKKPGNQEDKKKTTKADADQKTDKAERKAKVAEEKLVYGNWVKARLVRMDSNSNRVFGIAPMDPFKVQKFNYWKLQQLAGITQAPNLAVQLERMAAYQRELPNQATNLYADKDVEVRAADNMKVRTTFLPIKYDDAGNIVRWTAKEVRALQGKSKLPGYPAEMDALRPGQLVDVYFAKVQASSGSSKTKKLTIDDEVEEAMNRPEVVLIVVTMEAPMRR